MKDIDCEELYANADWYDKLTHDYIVDLPMYHRLAEECGGPILELACGTGRIAISLAARGHSVTGVDISSTMLNKARQKAIQAAVDVEWIHADIRSFDLKRVFSLIILPFNSICHIHDRESIEGLFCSVLKHMNLVSRFVVAMFVPSFDILSREQSERYPVGTVDRSEAGGGMVYETNVYDPASQINHIKWFYSLAELPNEIVIQNNMRMYFPQEFTALAHYNGLKVDTIWGDYDFSSFTNKSDQQIYVLRSAKADDELG